MDITELPSTAAPGQFRNLLKLCSSLKAWWGRVVLGSGRERVFLFLKLWGYRDDLETVKK